MQGPLKLKTPATPGPRVSDCVPKLLGFVCDGSVPRLSVTVRPPAGVLTVLPLASTVVTVKASGWPAVTDAGSPDTTSLLPVFAKHAKTPVEVAVGGGPPAAAAWSV